MVIGQCVSAFVEGRTSVRLTSSLLRGSLCRVLVILGDRVPPPTFSRLQLGLQFLFCIVLSSGRPNFLRTVPNPVSSSSSSSSSSGFLDTILGPAAKDLLLRLWLDKELSRNGFGVERDDFGGRDVEGDEGVDREVVPLSVEERQCVQRRETA